MVETIGYALEKIQEAFNGPSNVTHTFEQIPGDVDGQDVKEKA